MINYNPACTRKYIIRLGLLLCFLSFQLSMLSGQDTIILKNGNFIDGEIKSMENNLLTIDTDYGDKDFIIDWKEISKIYTSSYFRIYLANHELIYGWLKSSSDSTINIKSRFGEILSIKPLDIIMLTKIDKGFWNRMEAGFDIGMGIAKANNLRSLTTNAIIGYRTEKWYANAWINGLYSRQDSAEVIKRNEGAITLRYIFINDWAIDPSITFLSSTEQKLLLRTNIKLGFGKYLIHKYYGYWAIQGGINRNLERFTTETPDRNSYEGYFGSELKVYDLEDLDFYARFNVYPSLTEEGRWRADYISNIKYDLLLDFYVRLELNINYDNQPAEGASDLDYLLTLGFGWEL